MALFDIIYLYQRGVLRNFDGGSYGGKFIWMVGDKEEEGSVCSFKGKQNLLLLSIFFEIYFTIPRSDPFTKLTMFSISSLIGTWSMIFCTASVRLKLP